MKQTTVYILLLLLTACQSKDRLDVALEYAGDNRAELEKVLEHLSGRRNEIPGNTIPQRGQRIRMLGITQSLFDQKNTLRALLETLFHPRKRHRTPILGRCLDNGRDTTLGERHTDIQRRTARYNLPCTHRGNERPDIHV